MLFRIRGLAREGPRVLVAHLFHIQRLSQLHMEGPHATCGRQWNRLDPFVCCLAQRTSDSLCEIEENLAWSQMIAYVRAQKVKERTP